MLTQYHTSRRKLFRIRDMRPQSSETCPVSTSLRREYRGLMLVIRWMLQAPWFALRQLINKLICHKALEALTLLALSLS